jgi:hypothetical protein
VTTIGYAKLGRSMQFDTSRYGMQGDAEAPNLLRRLARRNPDVTWALVGRNNLGDTPFEPNVLNPWALRGITDDGVKATAGSPGFADKMSHYIATLDGVVIQVGQHGTSHQSIPQSGSTWRELDEDPLTHGTIPYDWAYTYAGFLIRGLNKLGDRHDGHVPMVWLVADPRNFIFARDLKWPTGMDDVLSQYQYSRPQRHERFRDPRTPDDLGVKHVEGLERGGELWIARHTHRHADLELMIVPDDWESWPSPSYADRISPIGVATTSFDTMENRATGGIPGGGGFGSVADKVRRSELVRDFVLASYPDAPVLGKWDKASLADVPTGTVRVNDPSEFYGLLASWRTTVALPALTTAWTVAKFYQACATRTVCFMLRNVDAQGWTLPSRFDGKPTSWADPTHEVAPGLYSVRDDWTENDLMLARWLRVETPDELKARVDTVNADLATWVWLVEAQHALLKRRWDAHYLESEIERKLGLR